MSIHDELSVHIASAMMDEALKSFLQGGYILTSLKMSLVGAKLGGSREEKEDALRIVGEEGWTLFVSGTMHAVHNWILETRSDATKADLDESLEDFTAAVDKYHDTWTDRIETTIQLWGNSGNLEDTL